jgi:chemotaxis signal transduction protein
MTKSRSNTKTRAPRKVAPLPMELGSQEVDEKTELVSVLLFQIDGASYAIGVEHTEGVVDCPRITPVPNPPDGVSGVTSVRGRMTVVMDLGTNGSSEPARQRLILLKGEAQLGLLADRVEGVLALERNKVRPIAHGKDGPTGQRARFNWPAQSYFKGDGTRVPILDIERLTEM